MQRIWNDDQSPGSQRIDPLDAMIQREDCRLEASASGPSRPALSAHRFRALSVLIGIVLTPDRSRLMGSISQATAIRIVMVQLAPYLQ